MEDYRFLRQHTDQPIKVTLPGPYLLTRAMWVKEVTRAIYESKEALGEDIVGVLRDECRELIDAGVDFIQFDEPVLTELVFTQGQTLTFMCAALAARKDPAEELELTIDLINRVVAGLAGVRIGLHICRGNWSRQESTLLTGSSRPLSRPTWRSWGQFSTSWSWSSPRRRAGGLRSAALLRSHPRSQGVRARGGQSPDRHGGERGGDRGTGGGGPAVPAA